MARGNASALLRRVWTCKSADFYANDIDLPEEALLPATLTVKDVQFLYHHFLDASVWFEGVEFPKNPAKGVEHPDGRGRLLLSPHAKYRYPDDSDAGADWVKSKVISPIAQMRTT